MSRPADPNGLNPTRWKKKSVGSFRHGKPRVQITMPVYIFNEIRKEAAEKERSVNSITIEWLEAAYGLSHEEGE